MTNYPCKNRNLGCEYNVWEEGGICPHCEDMGTPDNVYRKAVEEIADLYGSFGTNSKIVYSMLKKYFNEKRK